MKNFVLILGLFLVSILSPVSAMDGRGRGQGVAKERRAKTYDASFGHERKDSASFVIPTPSKVFAQSAPSYPKDVIPSAFSPSRSSVSCPSSSSTNSLLSSSDFPAFSSSSSGHSSSSSQSVASDASHFINMCPLHFPLSVPVSSQDWTAFSDSDDKSGEHLNDQPLHGRFDQLKLSGHDDVSRLPLSSSFLQSPSPFKASHLRSDEYSDNEGFQDDFEKDVIIQNPEFVVTFKNGQERLSILHCSDFHFCDFMKKAAALMASPEEVSLIRCYGFGLGHVPLLLVWSGHLHDRLTKSKLYCIKTNDLIDILSLILIIDLQAHVDAACIEKLKKNLKSAGSFAVDVHGPVFDQSKTAPDAARYLKSKLFTLWEPIILDLYRKKKLPKYRTILDRVTNIVASWSYENHPSPLWVCCPQKARGMTVANWWGAWPSDRFGNWWDPQKELIVACSIFEEEHTYHDVIQEQQSIVLSDFARYQSWFGYFGDLCSLEDICGEEYDSDGGF